MRRVRVSMSDHDDVLDGGAAVGVGDVVVRVGGDVVGGAAAVGQRRDPGEPRAVDADALRRAAGGSLRVKVRGYQNDTPVNLAFGTRTTLLEVIARLEEMLGRELARAHSATRPGNCSTPAGSSARSTRDGPRPTCK
jgi:hypothetical protein